MQIKFQFPTRLLSFRAKGRERKGIPTFHLPTDSVHYPTFHTFHFIRVSDFSALILNETFFSQQIFCSVVRVELLKTGVGIKEKNFFGNKLIELKMTIELKEFQITVKKKFAYLQFAWGKFI